MEQVVRIEGRLGGGSKKNTKVGKEEVRGGERGDDLVKVPPGGASSFTHAHRFSRNAAATGPGAKRGSARPLLCLSVCANSSHANQSETLHQQAARGEPMMRRREDGERRRRRNVHSLLPGRSFSPTWGRALTQPSRCIMVGSKGGGRRPPRREQAPEGGGEGGGRERGEQLDSSVAAPVIRCGVSIVHLRAAGSSRRSREGEEVEGGI